MATISNINKGKTVTSATIDGISFNSITHTGLGKEYVYVQNGTPWKTESTSTPMKYACNAVDIDWNQAILPDADLATGNGVTINTTGDLLSLINEMQKEIYVLSAAICALSGN